MRKLLYIVLFTTILSIEALPTLIAAVTGIARARSAASIPTTRLATEVIAAGLIGGCIDTIGVLLNTYRAVLCTM